MARVGHPLRTSRPSTWRPLVVPPPLASAASCAPQTSLSRSNLPLEIKPPSRKRRCGLRIFRVRHLPSTSNAQSVLSRHTVGARAAELSLLACSRHRCSKPCRRFSEFQTGDLRVGAAFDALIIDPDARGSPVDLSPEDSATQTFRRWLCLGDDRNTVEVYVQGTPMLLGR